MSNLKSIRLPVSANLKLTLVGLAFLIVAGTLYYTQQLVQDLKRSERRTVAFYAGLLQRTYRLETSQEMTDVVLTMTQEIHFPLILAEPDSSPKFEVHFETGDTSFVNYRKNVDLDTTSSAAEQKKYIRELIDEMGQTYAPLPIYTYNPANPRDSSINTLVYYDDSALIKQVRLMPLIGIIIIAMFILVGYISFSHIKRNEQSNIWVGMAKETAHQLGTPLSSLLGWIELLRYTPDDTTQVLEAADEMQRDVERLSRIAHRFSKIGSAAQVRPTEMSGVLRNVHRYFERRLPHLGKRVDLSIDAPDPVWAAINIDLFEWVFENLVRNAADAIDHAEGRIAITLREQRGQAIIDITDNGRGIDPKMRKDIFRPGFSTKQRGWGLGLSLAKRIVEEYHGGKILLKASSPQGTTFRIRLQTVAAPATSIPQNSRLNNR